MHIYYTKMFCMEMFRFYHLKLTASKQYIQTKLLHCIYYCTRGLLLTTV